EALVEEQPFVPNDNFDAELADLLPHVKADEVKRARYLEILETMGPDDPRVAGHRKKLTAQLF
ncbi:MAG: co-chaperone YbbN, partial [Actinobacteria bacterium]|nr:co-chaperone YbbN [Actinomycetota bacterium]